jgi:hypothetical protein
MFDADGDQPSLANLYFEIDNITLLDFPLTFQKRWIRDTILEQVYVHHYQGYGGGIEDGDIINVTVRNCRVESVGYDGIDTKQRGPSAKNVGLLFLNNRIERFCLWADTTGARGAQAGIDLHGVGTCIGNTIRNFGRAGHELHGIRMRTGNNPDIPYEGVQASHSQIIGNIVESNGLGTTIGIIVGSPYCEIIGGKVSDCTDGVSLTGNTKLLANYSSVSHVTVLSPTRYGIWLAGDGHTAANCMVENAGTYGYYNSGTNQGFIGNVYTGTGTAYFAGTTAALTQRLSGNTFDRNNLEGTFMPTIVGSTVAGVGTYSTQVGRYTRVGNRIFFDLAIVWSAHTGTGNMSVAGLPLPGISGIATSFSIWSSFLSFTGQLVAYGAGASPNITLAVMSGVGAVAPLAMDTNANITVSGCYTVA